MKLKQSLLLTTMTLLTFMSFHSQAGRQGVSYYYGLGLGIIAPTDLDIAGVGNLIVGIEEDGWSFEAIAFTSTKAGTDSPAVDYSANGTHFGLAYRTVERNNSWFKFKVSGTKMTFDTTDTTTDFDTSGNSYTIGWGMRMGTNSRLEIDYDFYDSNDLDAVHMITTRYFWGGSEYKGRKF
ncbi:hypothetical protein MNBD_GAMMA07-1915 [hydrothermal vent metagenome]|uniref:Outer membrane protein beta-barrel domain-containing protein n=1 Tax=hydrothermal vent metagenome TaxID=652676 RepID=A0A3B0WC39_9ZZZZ